MSQNESAQKQKLGNRPMQPWVKKKAVPAPESPEGNDEQEPEVNEEEESEESDDDEDDQMQRSNDLKIKDGLK